MKKRVIKTLISIGTYNDLLRQITELPRQKASSYVCISNVHMIIEGYQDPTFLDIVNSAAIATPDGMPIAKSIRLLYGIDQERVAGMDLMPDLIQECARHGHSIFLYGSSEKILNRIIEKAKKKYPSLQIDHYSPPFRKLSEDEKNRIVRMINDRKPDFVFVALGCPKQERWMAEHVGKIESCMIGLGGAFEVYAEVKERAPLWMQKYALEWLYRLYQDPRRLWKRYFVTNTLFLILLGRQLLKERLAKR